MNQLWNSISRNLKPLFWIVGFMIPLIFILIQVFFNFGTAPLMILMFSWFGIALFIYLGIYEE